MVTGDHKATGLAVARALGIAREGDREQLIQAILNVARNAAQATRTTPTNASWPASISPWFTVVRKLVTIAGDM